jgi:lipopolysaccharide export system protein LptA
MKLAVAPTAGLLALLASLALAADAPTPPQRTSLEADYGEFWSVKDETFFVFKSSATQRVVLVGTNLKLVCDHLEMTAVGLAKGDKTSTLPALEKFKYLLATGNVIIFQGEREARAGRAEVFPRQDKIELTEDPVIIDHAADKTVDGKVDHSDDYILPGEKITMLRGDRKVIVDKVKLSGPSIKDLGFDKKQPAPKADPKGEPKK